MGCVNSALVALNTAEQTLAAGAYIPFATNAVLKGLAISHVPGSTTASLVLPGVYLVTFNADVLPAAAGGVTLALYNNESAVPGAEASFTGVADTLVHVSFTTLVRVRRSCDCIDNDAALQVQLSDGATIANANITVVGFV